MAFKKAIYKEDRGSRDVVFVGSEAECKAKLRDLYDKNSDLDLEHIQDPNNWSWNDKWYGIAYQNGKNWVSDTQFELVEFQYKKEDDGKETVTRSTYRHKSITYTIGKYRV